MTKALTKNKFMPINYMKIIVSYCFLSIIVFFIKTSVVREGL